jgi:glycogen operon protein
MLAQGVPLVLAGDEVGNSQNGNNNTYCQDNVTGWIDWSGLDGEDDLRGLIAQLTSLRQRFRQTRPRGWVEGRRRDGSFGVLWLTPKATEMTEQDWNFPEGRFLSYVLGPLQENEEALFVVLNAAPHTIEFKFPELAGFNRWSLVLDTSPKPRSGEFVPGSRLDALPQAIVAFAGSA